jgi:bleomycin hydrolase
MFLLLRWSSGRRSLWKIPKCVIRCYCLCFTDADSKNRLALAALSSNPANAVLSNRSAVISDTQKFNIKIPLEGTPVTNQASSGRCWLFAATNVFRVAIMKKYKLSEFQLSQAYLFYWDKIEKANYFLESILNTTSEEVDSRLVQTLMESPVGDGGQWGASRNYRQLYESIN